MLSRFEHIHPRVEAALNAVPAAVLTTLVAPAAMQAGPAELVALVGGRPASRCAAACGGVPAGAAVLIVARQLVG